MATEIEIQNCKKILHDEIGQNDESDKVFDEFFEVLKKNQTTGSVDELSKEIVTFFNSKNFPTELLEYIVLNLDPGLSTLEEGFKEGLRLGREFEMKNAFITALTVLS